MVGPDGIILAHMKDLRGFWIKYCQNVMQEFKETRRISSYLNKTYILGLREKASVQGSEDNPDDFRIVTLTTMIVKVIQKAAQIWILEKNWYRHKEGQYGFVEKKTCGIQRDLEVKQLKEGKRREEIYCEQKNCSNDKRKDKKLEQNYLAIGWVARNLRGAMGMIKWISI